MRRTIMITTLLITLLLLAGIATAQKIPQPNSVVPCCGIIAINTTTGLVTARHTEMQMDFEFSVTNRVQLGRLRIGQSVNLDPRKQMVSIPGVPSNFRMQNLRRAGTNQPSIDVGRDFESCQRCQLNCIEQANEAFPKSDTDNQGTNGKKWLQFFEQCKALDGCNRNCFQSLEASNAVAASDAEPNIALETNEKWEITPNPDLKGAMGRITIRTPEKSYYSLTVFKAGSDQQSAYRYVGREFLLLPGQYDTRWWDNSKWRLTGVPVRRGMDTLIRAGALHLNLKYTEWVIYDETKTIVIEQGFDVRRVGLPVGKYYVKVNKAFAEVIITDGKVTEF